MPELLENLEQLIWGWQMYSEQPKYWFIFCSGFLSFCWISFAWLHHINILSSICCIYIRLVNEIFHWSSRWNGGLHYMEICKHPSLFNILIVAFKHISTTLVLHLYPFCIFILVASLSSLHLYPQCIFIRNASLSLFYLFPVASFSEFICNVQINCLQFSSAKLDWLGWDKEFGENL